jgi:hypothetical protein
MPTCSRYRSSREQHGFTWLPRVADIARQVPLILPRYSKTGLIGPYLLDQFLVEVDARETGQATTLMYALFFAGDNYMYCGNCAAARAQFDELIALADERGSPYWKGLGTAVRGLCFCIDRKSLGGSSDNHLEDHLTLVNWSNFL